MAPRRWTIEETCDFIDHCEMHLLAERLENEKRVIEDLCIEGRHEKSGTLRMVPVVGRREFISPDLSILPVGTNRWYDVVVDVPPFMPDRLIPLYVEKIVKPQLDEAWGKVPDWPGKIE